jgi:hypothetical protein
MALPGIGIAAIFSFILGMNAYATPVLLGGLRFQMMAPLNRVGLASERGRVTGLIRPTGRPQADPEPGYHLHDQHTAAVRQPFGCYHDMSHANDYVRKEHAPAMNTLAALLLLPVLARAVG